MNGFVEVFPASHQVNWDRNLQVLRGGFDADHLVRQDWRKGWLLHIKIVIVSDFRFKYDPYNKGTETDDRFRFFFSRVALLVVAGDNIADGIA